MPEKVHRSLTAGTRGCRQTVRKLSGSSVRRAQVLLKADADGQRGPTSRSPTPFRAAPRPSEQPACWKASSRRWNENGGSRRRSPNCSTANRRRRSSPCVWGHPPTPTGRCGGAPSVELAIVESISHETIRRMLKKTNEQRKVEYWVPAAGRCPPWNRSSTSDRTTRLARSMDEQSVQLVPAMAATKERPPPCRPNTNGRAARSSFGSRWRVGGRRRRGTAYEADWAIARRPEAARVREARQPEHAHEGAFQRSSRAEPGTWLSHRSACRGERTQSMTLHRDSRASSPPHVLGGRSRCAQVRLRRGCYGARICYNSAASSLRVESGNSAHGSGWLVRAAELEVVQQGFDVLPVRVPAGLQLHRQHVFGGSAGHDEVR